MFGLLAFGKSYREGKAKDAALESFKKESTVAIANATARAADAVSKQAGFEIQLEAQRQTTEAQRERAASAEKALLDLHRLINEPRRLSNEEEAVNMLKEGPKGTVSISHVDNEEAERLALQIFTIIQWGGWKAEPPTPKLPGGMLSSPTIGVELLFNQYVGFDPVTSEIVIPEPGDTLKRALSLCVPRFSCKYGWGLQKGELRVIVGPKY